MRLLQLLAAPVLAAAQAISISKVQYSGNGCPQGTASVSLSSDKTVSQLPHYTIAQLAIPSLC